MSLLFNLTINYSRPDHEIFFYCSIKIINIVRTRYIKNPNNAKLDFYVNLKGG